MFLVVVLACCSCSNFNNTMSQDVIFRRVNFLNKGTGLQERIHKVNYSEHSN